MWSVSPSFSKSQSTSDPAESLCLLLLFNISERQSRAFLCRRGWTSRPPLLFHSFIDSVRWQMRGGKNNNKRNKWRERNRVKVDSKEKVMGENAVTKVLTGIWSILIKRWWLCKSQPDYASFIPAWIRWCGGAEKMKVDVLKWNGSIELVWTAETFQIFDHVQRLKWNSSDCTHLGKWSQTVSGSPRGFIHVIVVITCITFCVS